MRFVLGLISGLFLIAGVALPAQAERRVALVIGQDAYKSLNALKNPSFDAETLAKILKERDFDVISCDGRRPGCYDLSHNAFMTAVAQLATKSKGAALAFFFYAGHGMEGAEGNILAPTDATIECTTQQIAGGVLVDEVLEALQGAQQKIVVIDACRDNPLGDICPPATKTKITFRQFRIADAGNFLLFSSTKPGQVALDGLPGAHSPFARAIFAALAAAPTMHFDQIFNRVSKNVIEESAKVNFTQIPEMLIRGGAPEACLAGAACAADPQANAAREELEVLKRERARDQEFIAPGKAYLAQIEKNYGRPLSEDERGRALEAYNDTLRLLAVRNDDRGERALERLKTGNTGEAERLFQEDLDAEAAEERAEARRRTERRAKAAVSARSLATLARAYNVAKALTFYRQAVDLDPDDGGTWEAYARTLADAGKLEDAKAALIQAIPIASKATAGRLRYLLADGQGEIAQAEGHLSQALQYYVDARQQAASLAAEKPLDDGAQLDLAASNNRIAEVLLAQGKPTDALRYYSRGLEITGLVASAHPENVRWPGTAWKSAFGIGESFRVQQNLSAALDAFRVSLTVADQLKDLGADDSIWQNNRAGSIERIGYILLVQGRPEEALANFKSTLAAFERLTQADPANKKWQHNLFVNYRSAGEALAALGRFAEAMNFAEKASAIAEQLVAADSRIAVWQRDLRESEVLKRRILLQQNPDHQQ
jgi:tetratricopeptide (TPR) repeat protein